MSVYNSASTLDAQLAALAVQTYRGPWELVLADNGSTDRSRSVAEAWAGRIPVLRVVDASERLGDPTARNVGCRHASGSMLAFCDSDDVVDGEWLASLVTGLSSHDVVAGACQFFETEAPAPDGSGESPQETFDGGYGYLPFGLGANLAILTEVFRSVGGFDEDYQAAADVDLCWKAQLAGYRFGYEPAALLHKRRRGTLRSAWHRHFVYGQDDPILFRQFGGQGMPRSYGRMLRTYGWLIVNAFRLYDPIVRTTWVRVCGKSLGRAKGSWRHRAIYL